MADRLDDTLLRIAQRTRRERAMIRQAIVVATNIGYSGLVLASWDLGNAQRPKPAFDLPLMAAMMAVLYITVTFAPLAEV